MKRIRIRWWSKSDIVGFLYSKGYKNTMYLTGQISEREYEYEEENVPDADSEPLQIFQKIIKEWKLTNVVMTPQQRDVLESISVHDKIEVTYHNGDTQFVKNFKVEGSNFDGIAYNDVIVTFQTDYQINRALIQQYEIDCETNKLANVNGIIVNIGDLVGVSLFEGMRILFNWGAVGNDIYVYKQGQFVQTFEKAEQKWFLNLANSKQYFYNGTEWVLTPAITAVTFVSGSRYRVKGTAKAGFVRIEGSSDAGATWSTLKEDVSGFFNSVGILTTIPASVELLRAVTYQHSCGNFDATSANFTAPDATIYITVDPLELVFNNTNINTPSNVLEFEIEGTGDESTDAVITAPTNFEVSLNNITFSSSVTVLFSGGIPQTTIYARCLSATEGGLKTGFITIVVDGKTYRVAVRCTVNCVASTSCADASWELQDTAGATLDTGTIASGGSDIIEAPDATYEVKYTPSNTPIESGNIVSGGSKTVLVPDPIVCEGWSPPADWKWDDASALLLDSENGVVLLHPVYEGMDNYATIMCYFAGTGTINLGDGSGVQALTTGVKLNILFDYDNIPTAFVPSIGGKMAVVLVKITGSLTHLFLREDNDIQGAFRGNSKWLALKLRTNVHLAMFLSSQYGRSAGNLQIIDLGACLLKANGSNNFYNLKSLQYLLWGGFENVIGDASQRLFETSNMSGVHLDTISFSKMTSLYYAFNGAIGGVQLEFDKAINECLSLQGAWRDTSCFRKIKLTNTGKVTNLQECLYLSGVEDFEMDDCSQVTTTAWFIYPHAPGRNHTQRLILNLLTVGIDISHAKMDALALNNFFIGLGTANGAQTITITGCTGAGTCDQTIATAKGFTIVN